MGVTPPGVLRDGYQRLSTARPEIPEKPHQPLTLCFPEREFSKKQVVKPIVSDILVQAL